MDKKKLFSTYSNFCCRPCRPNLPGGSCSITCRWLRVLVQRPVTRSNRSPGTIILCLKLESGASNCSRWFSLDGFCTSKSSKSTSLDAFGVSDGLDQELDGLRVAVRSASAPALMSTATTFHERSCGVAEVGVGAGLEQKLGHLVAAL
jgi:hypothetical protein